MAGIPVIEAYPLPAEGQLPANVARWTADPTRAVLLIHDMQRYFVRRIPADGARRTLVERIALLRERCRALRVPVAYTAQPGGMSDRQRGLLKDFWGPGMRVSPADRTIVDPLAPAPGDWVLDKWRYSAFFRSDLLDRMRRHGRDQVVVCGVYAHIGILVTAIEAYSNDIQPFVVADAVADFSEREHRMALEYAAAHCAVVSTAKTVISQLEAGPAAARDTAPEAS
jgi:trans-2,3-dihydro-3-hydroxyanthranilic acid synthase